MHTQICPDDATLESLLLGRLSISEYERLEKHLLECDACGNRAGQIQASDELLKAIQAPFIIDSQVSGMDVLILRGRQIFAETRDLVNDETADFSHDLSDIASPTETESAAYSFLQPAQEPDEIGRFGNYRILNQLGKGGMGIVFLAEEITLRRQVALKVIKPLIVADSNARHRFMREARAMAAVVSDHIVSIHQVGEVDSVPYLEMPVLQGESLSTRLNCEERLSFADVCQIGEQTAAGLAAAHKRGLIHRDIKPDNIWLEATNNRVKILDFGLARCDDDPEMTSLGALVGTPRYMSPEQTEGKPVDYRSDLFSLGSLLYHCASWQPPFQGDSTTSTLLAVVKANPTPIMELCPDIPQPLADLIMDLLKKSPKQRPKSADEVAKRLHEILISDSVEKATRLNPHPNPLPQLATSLPINGNSFGRVGIAIGTTILLGFLIWLASILITIKTPDGNIVVEIDSGGKPVEINVLEDDTLVIQDPNDGKEIRVTIDPKQHLLHMEKAGFVAVTKNFSLTSPGGRRISVRFELPDKTLDAEAQGNSVALSGDPATGNHLPDASNERQIAEWIINRGGHIEPVTTDSVKHVRASEVASLPPDDFLIRSIELGSEATSEALQTLAGCKKLQELSLTGCWRLQPSDFQIIANIEGLSTLLLASTQLSDPFIKELAEFPSLSTLKVVGTPDIDALVKLSQLETLELSGNDLSALNLKPLAEMTNLNRLRLIETGLTVEQVRNVHKLLASCDVESDFSDEQIRAPEIAAARNHDIASWLIRRGGTISIGSKTIESLDDLPDSGEPIQYATLRLVQINDLRDEEFEVFSGWSADAEFQFDGSPITGEGFKYLPKERVSSLWAQSCEKLNGDSFRYLSGASILESLLFSGSNAGDELAVMANSLPKLRSLHLGRNATGDSIRTLAGNKAIETLCVWNCDGITEKDFADLAAIPSLKHVLIGEEQLSSPFVNQLAKVLQLNSLQVGEGTLDLELLTQLDQIEDLELSYRDLTDTDLSPLTRMKSLSKLTIRSTGLNAQAVKSLSATLPNCDIWSDEGSVQRTNKTSADD